MMPVSRSVTALFATGVAVFAAGFASDADARQSRRGEPDTFARYAEPALRDSLMATTGAPGVIVLERDFVRFGKGGDAVSAEVTYERVLFVKSPEGLADYREFTLPDRPGSEIDELEAIRITGDDHKRVDVKKVNDVDCALHKKHRHWVVDFGEFESGDMLCVKVQYKIEGVNPEFTHAFDHKLPVVQSDVTFEVPRDLMEGKASRAFNFWAGSWPGGINQEAWERPRSWRFRWGERSLPALEAGETARIVTSTWAFDPRQMGASMEAKELKASGASDAGYTGPTLSAQSLSGRWTSGSDGNRRGEDTTPTTASLGELSWQDVADRVLSLNLNETFSTKGLDRVLDKLVTHNASPAAVVAAVASFVSSEIETIDISLADSWQDVKKSHDVVRRPCATKLDKAVLASSLLRSRGIDAYPVLMMGTLDIDFVSVTAFDDVCVRVDGEGGGFLDLDSGKMTPRLRSSWRAILFLDDDEGARGLIHGDELTALSL